ncbi:hypothetical protein ScPMuIL_007601 [Solemya velum]
MADTHKVDEPEDGDLVKLCSQPQVGFVTASSIFCATVETKPEAKHQMNKLSANFSLPKSVSQGSIMEFMTAKKSAPQEVTKSTGTFTTCSQVGGCPKSVDIDASQCSPQRKRSKMFSPIKQFSPNSRLIYVSDSSPTSSPQESAKVENCAVKKLFDAQKKLNHNHTNVIRKRPVKRCKTKKTRNDSKLKNDLCNYMEISDSSCSSIVNESSGDEKEHTFRVSDKYGLLGTGHSSNLLKKPILSTCNHFDRLPLEVVENIFCMLPMLDLCLNSNRVCTAWNVIISNSKFVPWKKRYHMIKKDVGESRIHVRALMRSNGMLNYPDFLLGLIRYMKNFKPVTAANMSECLQKHSKYHWAKSLMEERISDCISNGVPNVWSVITTLVIVSHHVHDIQEAIACLSVGTSQCTSMEIIECLYCIATFLYAFKLIKNNDVWNGMHYRLFYALYLFENSSTTSCADLQSSITDTVGQQTILKYSGNSLRLTHEQLRIVNHRTDPGDIVKIVAFAGFGKTTTLVRYTQLHPNMKFLLVVYNKSVCEHAKTKFPHNVTCKTGHALAFGHVGKRYQFSNKLKPYGVKVYDLTQLLRLVKGENLYIRAKFVLDTLNNFMASSDDDITTAHVPTEQLDDYGVKKPIKHESRMLYAEDAKHVWRRMIDLNDKAVPISHDGYLKLYQLSRPKLTEYDCILIDEAQDMTPALTSILLTQGQSKILVGDPHQQIYAFRGAVNAMQQVNATKIFYLTQSFRFGPEIAQVAAFCLELLKSEKERTLVGSAFSGDVLGEQKGQLAILCRCNFTLFKEAVTKCCFSEEPIKVAFVGGTEGFGFSMLQDIYTLMLPEGDQKKERRYVQNKFVRMFKNIGDLEKYAEKTNDVELLGKIRIVKTYHHSLPSHIQKILSKTSRDMSQADIVFSTAHKAKGLEFSTVRLTDDFSMPQAVIAKMQVLFPDFTMNMRPSTSDEGNLLYVAATRAKRALQMSPTLLNIMTMAGEKFIYPVFTDELKKKDTEFKCKETDVEFTPLAITLQKRDITLGDGIVRKGGLIGPEIIAEDGGSFAQLLGSLKKEPGNG